MNKTLTLLAVVYLISLATTQTIFAQTSLSNDNFNDSSGTWTSGGNNAIWYDLDNIGEYSSAFTYSCTNLADNVFLLRDDNGAASSIISQTYDLSGYDSVAFEYDYAVFEMNNTSDDWFLEFSDNNGATWQTAKHYDRTQDYYSGHCGVWGSNSKEVVTLQSSDYTFNSTNKFRLRAQDVTNNLGFLFVDNIVVAGYANISLNDLFYEDFEDNTSSGNSNNFSGNDEISNIPWNAVKQGNVNRWQIEDGKWKGKRVRGASSLTTDPFSISGYQALQFEFDVEFQNLTGSQINKLRVFYTIDSGPEQLLVQYMAQNPSQIYTVNLPSTATGNNITLRIEMLHHGSSGNSNAVYKVDYIKLKGFTTPCTTPSVYNVTGDDLFICAGSSDTREIGLDNSETGVTYQLAKDGNNIGLTVAGTGSAINFGSYGDTGTFTVVATRTDGGCTAPMSGNVVITTIAAVTASFTTSATILDINETITFTNTSSNAISYSWDFGDSSAVSTATNPTHSYSAAGTYAVTLTATHSCGSDTETTTITVTNAPVDLFFENFSGYNDTSTPPITGTGTSTTNPTAGVVWTLDAPTSADEIRLHNDGGVGSNGHIHTKKVNGTATFETAPILVSGYTNLNFGLYIDKLEKLDAGDEIELGYNIDNQGYTALYTQTAYGVWTPSGNKVEDVTLEADITAIGNSIILYIKITHDNNWSEKFEWDDVKLTGILDCSGISNDITDATAAAGDTQAILGWSNPNANCTSIDEVMVIAKANSAVTNSPSGNGSAYTANAAFGSGTAFDGGSVVYKGAAEIVTVTGLTNGTTYYLTTFTREGTTWSSGVTVTVTPIESPYLFFEDFEDEANEAITGTDVNGIGWSATLNGHDADYFGVDTQNSNKLFRVDDLEDDREGIKWESNTINIAGKTDLELSAYLEFDETDSNDYLIVKVLVDGFFATTVASFEDDVDDQDGNKSWLLVDTSGNPITGNTLKIIIEFFHDSSEEYLVDNIRLTDGNYWLGDETDAITNTEKWSYKELPTATSNAKIASGAHLKLSNLDTTIKNVTVNGELTIEKDASLTTTADFKNSGTVNLNSDDNEFSSLLVEGTATGSISYNRWVNNYEAGTNGNDVISSPVTGESWMSVMSNNGATIYNNGTLWSFTPYNNGYANWGDFYTSSTSVDIITGKGYRVASPAGNSQTVKFTGELVNGAVTVQLSRIQTRWNVVGNPYATYIDLAKFIQVNQASLDEGYVLVLGYNGVNNTDGWAYYNLATALANNIKIAPGQGFYLAAKNNNSTVVFNPSMKTVSGSDDFLQNGARSTTVDMQKLRLNVNNASKTRHAELYFFNRDDVSNNFDLGYDALIKNDGDNFNLYSAPLDGTVNKLAIQTSHLDNMETRIIPVGVEAQAGQQLTFSIDNLTIADNITIWLEDRATGVWTELNSTSTYVLNTAEIISGIGRFYIHFENQETLNIQDINSNQIEIKAISGANIITVSGNLDRDSVLELYDVAGRKLLTQNLDSYKTMHRIDVEHLPVAAYIVNVHNDTQKTSKQIIIN